MRCVKAEQHVNSNPQGTGVPLSEESILSSGVIGMTSSCNAYSLPDTDRSVPGEYGGQEVDPRASWAQISTRPSIELFGDAKELVRSYIVPRSK